MGSNRLAKQSFGLFKICKDYILFELFLWKKKEERRRKKMNKIKFSTLVFSIVLKVSITFTVDIASEWQGK